MSELDIFLKNKDKIDSKIISFREVYKCPVINNTELRELINVIASTRGFGSLSQENILSFLLKFKYIKHRKIEGEYITQYYDEKVDFIDILNSLYRSSYFSHNSALFIHGLLSRKPLDFYVSNERKTENILAGKLKQSRIDEAFENEPRISSNTKEISKFKITHLQNQNHQGIGIISYRKFYKVTDLERTLIDAIVRPFYCGEAGTVLKAYKKARGMLDTVKLYDYYSSMQFTYPYHQSIGFLLQKAGYEEKEYGLFKEFKHKFDFYLTYNIVEPKYSKEWKLYYPKGI